LSEQEKYRGIEIRMSRQGNKSLYKWNLIILWTSPFVPVSTTDLLIAAAAYKKARLLHADRDFGIISSVVELDEERIE